MIKPVLLILFFCFAARPIFSELKSPDYQKFLDKLASYESVDGPNHGYGLFDRSMHLGRYQMGEYALKTAGYYKGDKTRRIDWIGHWTGKYGVTNIATFLSNTSAQEDAIRAYHIDVWNDLVHQKLVRYIGVKVRGVQITASGLLAAGHLVGTGENGILTFFQTNKQEPMDGNKVSAYRYIKAMSGYSLAQLFEWTNQNQLSKNSSTSNQ